MEVMLRKHMQKVSLGAQKGKNFMTAEKSLKF